MGQGEEDHVNVLDLPEALVEDVFVDPRGPGFDQEKQEKWSPFSKLFLIIFIVAAISAGIFLFTTNVAQWKSQTIDKSEKQKSQPELVVVDQKKEIQGNAKYEAQSEFNTNNPTDVIASTGLKNDENTERAVANKQKEPFLKRIFKYFSRVKRKKLFAMLAMFTFLGVAFFQQKYSTAPTGTNIKELANSITEARTLNRPFHNWFASAPNIKTNDKHLMTKNEPFIKYFTSQMSCDQILPESQSLVPTRVNGKSSLKNFFNRWGADHWHTNGKNVQTTLENIQ